MHTGKLVFAQVIQLAPWHTFRRLITKYRGDFSVRTFSRLGQFLCNGVCAILLEHIGQHRAAEFERAYHQRERVGHGGLPQTTEFLENQGRFSERVRQTDLEFVSTGIEPHPDRIRAYKVYNPSEGVRVVCGQWSTVQNNPLYRRLLRPVLSAGTPRAVLAGRFSPRRRRRSRPPRRRCATSSTRSARISTGFE
ncbi:MAG: DUF4372 domain-containing protein [Gammaproteobacteria bacterium]|nr:DUF4372 domain-containing protein [Gammaproteobacteria bacterium]